LREFAKTTDQFARDLETMGLLDGSPLLELAFGAPEGGPVVCRLVVAADGAVRKIVDVDAVLIVATKELCGDEGGAGPAGTQSSAVQAVAPAATASPNVAATQQPTNGRVPQPRQGSKRRAVASLPSVEAFDAFPDHSDSSQMTAALPVRTQSNKTTDVRTPQAHFGAPEPRPQMAQPDLQRHPQQLQQLPHLQGPPIVHQGMQQLSHQLSHLQQRPALAELRPPQQQRQQQQLQQPLQQPQQLLHQQAWELSNSAPANCQQIQPVPMTTAAGAPVFSATPSSIPPTLPAQVFPGLQGRQQQPPGQLQQHQGVATFVGGSGSGYAAPAPGIHPAPQSVPVAYINSAANGVGVPAAPITRPATVLASQLGPALHVPDDSDDELIGADPDEVAFGVPLGPKGDDDSVDWFDVTKLW